MCWPRTVARCAARRLAARVFQKNIASTRAWMKSYVICAALVKNPKTPPAISLNLMPRLTDRDLRNLSTDRNVPEVVRMTARRRAARLKT